MIYVFFPNLLKNSRSLIMLKLRCLHRFVRFLCSFIQITCLETKPLRPDIYSLFSHLFIYLFALTGMDER